MKKMKDELNNNRQATSNEGKIIEFNETAVKEHLAGMVLATVEETLNALLDAEASKLCGAKRYERSDGRKDTRAGKYERQMDTKAGKVKLQVPKLAFQIFFGASAARISNTL
jgi:transposase-like protein